MNGTRQRKNLCFPYSHTFDLRQNNFPLNSENYWLLQCTNQDETLMPVQLT